MRTPLVGRKERDLHGPICSRGPAVRGGEVEAIVSPSVCAQPGFEPKRPIRRAEVESELSTLLSLYVSRSRVDPSARDSTPLAAPRTVRTWLANWRRCSAVNISRSTPKASTVFSSASSPRPYGGVGLKECELGRGLDLSRVPARLCSGLGNDGRGRKQSCRVAAAAYVLLRPRAANATGSGDATFARVSDAQIATEAFVLFWLPSVTYRAVAGGAAWSYRALAATGGTTSITFRGTQDVYSGSFSGVGTYVVDGITGSVIGTVVPGGVRLAGRGVLRGLDALATRGVARVAVAHP